MNCPNHSIQKLNYYVLSARLYEGLDLIWICLHVLNLHPIVIVTIINLMYLRIFVLCTRTIPVARIAVLGSQHLPDTVFMAIHIAFIPWQIVQVTTIVCFRATVVGIRVDRSTANPLVISHDQFTGTIYFIAVLFINETWPQ